MVQQWTYSHYGSTPDFYAVKVPGSEESGFSPIYRNSDSETLKSARDYGNLSTMWDVFQKGLQRNPNAPCLGKRVVNEDGSYGPYVFMTYKEVEESAIAVGSALAQLPIVSQPSDNPKVKDSKMVGLFLPNCVEWVILEQACNAYGYTLVPIYNTLGHQSIHTILMNSQLSVLLCNADTVGVIFQVLEQGMTDVALKVIILIGCDSVPSELESNKFSLKIILWTDLVDMGKKQPLPISPPHPDTLAIISYTSGTSGTPKGVMITQQNITDLLVVTCEHHVKRSFPDSCLERHISYLPMAHLLEKNFVNAVLYNGGCVGLYSGDIKKLLDDIQELKPTFFLGVPRLYQRIHDKIMSGVESKSRIVKGLFMAGLASKMGNIKKHGKYTHAFWDMLVFNKVKQLLGGRVRWMFVGSSSMSPIIVERLRAIFGVPLIWGYALTESCAGTVAQHFYDTDATNCGGIVSNQQFRLRSVPDMQYYADMDPPRGEMLIRGNCVMHGYYHNEKATSEALVDGWLYTGDIVEVLSSGAIRVIDRVKNVFKLAQGEYVSPDQIESIINLCPLVAQSFVVGRSEEVAPVAVIVPDEEALGPWKAANGMEDASFETVCGSAELRAAIMKDLDRLFTENNVRGYEKVKAIHLDHELFSVENDLLTVTSKLRRHLLRIRYSKAIDEMYDQVRASIKST
ncbi:fatty acyl-CoA synthetase 3 [Babesia divergens]|uniref:Long-chain-fatty-acid--CoA ligase n=1 Tax=Babesia divergens TaxID=32595 RepID=A0AAD9GFG0_BABDI|nr:fatty acyl-CoA synthetase 3 [Babesia divergens]